MKSWIQEHKNKTLLLVTVRPGASKTSIEGEFGDPVRLRIKVAAPPVEGAANEELIRFLAKKLKLAKSEIEILRGHHSKNKDILLNLSIEEARVVLVDA